MNEVIIGLGSNIKPHENIHKAKLILFTTYNVIAVSRFVTTKPIGAFNQPDYVNGVILIKTNHDVAKLKEKLKKIEKDLGRIKTLHKYDPRTIDIDIIVWNREIVDPDFYTRDYLKRSVLELIPDLKIEKFASH